MFGSSPDGFVFAVSAPMTLAPGTRLGSYELRSALGAGGMGEVYRALDTKLDREVAVKVLIASVASDPDRVAPAISRA